MNSNLLKLMKKSGSARKYKNKNIEDKIVKLIAEAGVWGPSIFGVQPWRFIVIKRKMMIKKIASIVHAESKKRNGVFEKLLQMAAKIIRNGRIVIAVYTTNKIRKNVAKYGFTYMKKAWTAELLSTGAAVQNMLLMSNNLGIGSVWLDTPAVFPDKINKILKERNELAVLLVFGHPDQKIQRSYREIAKIIRYI